MRPFVVLVLVAACGGPSAPNAVPAPESPPVAPASTETDAEALARAEAGAKALGGTLKARVVESLGQDGPAGAVETCHAEAGALTAKVATEQGVAVGRSSLRLRNPGNAGPAWVDAWLATNGERPAAGVTPLREVVATDAGREAHVILPIAVDAACLVCHGIPEQIPDDVEAVLATRYPDDKARGYAEGDLRGALWASTAVR